ncbi:MAG: VWA domain-containing protein [Solirubrobacteraceae bacterium]|nr:VWA domain-containing protein [Solirubrobacteraceae bacterium]
MSFLSPLVLFGLLLVPLAAWWYLASDRRRRAGAAAFASAPVSPSVAPRRTGWRRHVGPGAYLLALVALLLAAARPEAKVSVKVQKASVMLVTDRSGSMAADDVAGGRISAVKNAAGLFLDRVPDDVRTGLIAFNQDVQVLQSPTTDKAAVRAQVQTLEPGGSTATGDALARAVSLLSPKSQQPAQGTDGTQGTTPKGPPAAIILLSDGKSVRGQDPVAAAEEAKKAGIRIYTIALGTDQGVLRGRRKDGTERVQNVPPDRATMAKIAETSGGEAFDAPTAEALDQVYEQLGRQVATRKEPREVTVAFAGGALALLLVGAGASLALVGRPL